MDVKHRKTPMKTSGMISKNREELNEIYIHFLHIHMKKRDSNLYLLRNVHKPTPKKRAILDTKHTLLGTVSISEDHQLQCVKHILPTTIQDSQEIQRLIQGKKNLPPGKKLFTAYAVAMYPNIYIDKGMLATERLFEVKKRLTG